PDRQQNARLHGVTCPSAFGLPAVVRRAAETAEVLSGARGAAGLALVRSTHARKSPTSCWPFLLPMISRYATSSVLSVLLVLSSWPSTAACARVGSVMVRSTVVC